MTRLGRRTHVSVKCQGKRRVLSVTVLRSNVIHPNPGTNPCSLTPVSAPAIDSCLIVAPVPCRQGHVTSRSRHRTVALLHFCAALRTWLDDHVLNWGPSRKVFEGPTRIETCCRRYQGPSMVARPRRGPPYLAAASYAPFAYVVVLHAIVSYRIVSRCFDICVTLQTRLYLRSSRVETCLSDPETW
jgi:hypothetical protein